MTKWSMPVTLLVALAAVGARPALAADPPDAEVEVADADLAAWVDRQVDERQPGPDDKRFDEIGFGNGPHAHRIDKQSLTATVVSVDGKKARARLEGGLRMKHTFYPDRDDNNFVEATLLGYLDFEPGTRKVRALRLVTTNATYAQHGFKAALRSQ